jgi:hypothetical protein
VSDPQLIVQVFFGLIAAALVTQAITDMRAKHWKIGTFLLVAGLVCLLFATKWPKISTLVPPRFTAMIEMVATDFRFWLAVIAIPYGYSVIRTLRHEMAKTAVEKDLQMMWGILKTFVLPRELTATQRTSISRYLKQFPPHKATLRWLRDDNEAEDFLSEVEIALKQGGWTIINNSPTENERDVPDGLTVEVLEPPHATNAPPDPGNPKTDILLKQAFAQAGVEIDYCGISPTDKAEEVVTVTVGHQRRPSTRPS